MQYSASSGAAPSEVLPPPARACEAPRRHYSGVVPQRCCATSYCSRVVVGVARTWPVGQARGGEAVRGALEASYSENREGGQHGRGGRVSWAFVSPHGASWIGVLSSEL